MLSIDAQLGRDGVIELISLDVDASISGDDVDGDGETTRTVKNPNAITPHLENRASVYLKLAPSQYLPHASPEPRWPAPIGPSRRKWAARPDL